MNIEDIGPEHLYTPEGEAALAESYRVAGQLNKSVRLLKPIDVTDVVLGTMLFLLDAMDQQLDAMDQHPMDEQSFIIDLWERIGNVAAMIARGKIEAGVPPVQ